LLRQAKTGATAVGRRRTAIAPPNADAKVLLPSGVIDRALLGRAAALTWDSRAERTVDAGT